MCGSVCEFEYLIPFYKKVMAQIPKISKSTLFSWSTVRELSHNNNNFQRPSEHTIVGVHAYILQQWSADMHTC